MDQIVSIGKTITSEEFKCIQAAMRFGEKNFIYRFLIKQESE